MRVTVRYFAIFRELTGVESESVETEAATARDLFNEIMKRHAALAHDPAALVAINDQMADWASPLAESDEVLFFPPVAGG